jgi:hypothetical protein
MEWIFALNETSSEAIQDQFGRFEYDDPSPDRSLSRTAHCNHDVNIQIEYTILSHLEKMQELKALSFEVETISNNNSDHLPIQSRICVTQAICRETGLGSAQARMVQTFPPIQQTFDNDDNPEKSNLTS